MKERIYVCHTFYHVYIACLKELTGVYSHEQGAVAPESTCDTLAKKHSKELGATVVLSRVFLDFGDLKSRLEESGIFREVFDYDEKAAEFFPELSKYRVNSGNIFLHMIRRIIFTKKLGKAQIPYLPVDFRHYRDIYVFCDSDPIGYYLNYARIPYHAVEDGLDCLSNFDAAHFDNRRFFRFKAWMSALNLIFIQNGYGKYCLDMEVNDISVVPNPIPNVIEQPRAELVNKLSTADQEALLKIFVADLDGLQAKLREVKEPFVLLLTEEIGDIETRERIFTAAIDRHGQLNGRPAKIVIKPHPRDTLDYQTLFPEHIVLNRLFPMEMLNFIPNLEVGRVISVLTVLKGVTFSAETLFLGLDFLDEFIDPQTYRRNEQI
ncbi:MAG: glycosyltransferase family 52 protein [Lachnospiraceae bacterium]|jgi:hypothetical protein|nr:glycosyltransferase family 52 protein [Lachnospiraceae bacterium]